MQYTVTVKAPKFGTSTNRIEKGMSVNVWMPDNMPPTSNDGKIRINDMFIKQLGVDLKAMYALNTAYLDIKKSF